MGFNIDYHGSFPSKPSAKAIKNENYNTRVALWQMPYCSKYRFYDKDNSKWFETINKNYDNEIEKVEKGLGISLNRFKVYTKTIEYEDESVEEISKYPNGNEVKVTKGLNHVLVYIKDKEGRPVAEKIYNYQSNEGRKILYKYLKQGNNTLTIIQVFSYDTQKNKSSDIVNFGYTSLPSTLTDNCQFEREHYLINGQEAKLVESDCGEYIVKDKNRKKFIFKDY